MKPQLAQLIEQAIPKPKKRVKATPVSVKQEEAKDVLKASRRAATATPKSKVKPERFLISDPPISQKRVVDDDAPIAQLARRRRLMGNKILDM